MDGEKKRDEVRENRQCRSVGGWWGHLLNLLRYLGTYGNPIFFWLAYLNTKTKKGRVRVQTRNLGEKDIKPWGIRGAGGLRWIGARDETT
jgi:hypothetical protein